MFTVFYSDPHFWHKKKELLVKREYNYTEDMIKDFVLRYNSCVRSDDHCLWLGDAFFGPQKNAKGVLDSMNGVKSIVRGNHDRSARWLLSAGFKYVFDNPINLSIAGCPIRASHYPYRYTIIDSPYHKNKECYPMPRQGEVLIHGHTHKTNVVYGKQIHVGVDAWNYYPVYMEQIEALVRGIIYKQKKEEEDAFQDG